MVNAQESDKARGYIQQLDEARCASKWGDVPELCRKVEKHAPHRKCLTLTARAEAKIAAYSTQRPSTAASTASNGLSQIIPSLLTAIEDHSGGGQDAFQASVCLGWLHYVLDEPGLAVSRLPKDVGAAAASLAGEAGTLSGWSHVCVIKAAYLKGSAQEKTGTVAEALSTYSEIMPWLSSTTTTAHSPQSKIWTENLLVRLCELSDQTASTSDSISAPDALRTYRYWAKFWETTSKSEGHDAPHAARNRRTAWKSYYDSLSTILRHDLPYDPEDTAATSEKPPTPHHSSLRLRQRAELKRVETVYETLLLKETHFPKASESNHEVEAWSDSVIDNWRLLCGPTWTDADLGEGGKEGVGRGILDILYRAATKTFHSTQILRYLFIVHASLAEFELAFKAYDSYVEIITRGKDRAEKTGEPDVGIDDDSTVLRTSAEAIHLLCRFGGRKDAEKALEIGENIEKWLEQSEHIRSSSDAGSFASTETSVEPAALAVAYGAIGISQAHWARYTYEVEKRGEFQAKAIQHLRKSLSPSLGEQNNLEALYALALVLAETRDIPAAIKVVKRALSPATKNTTAISADGVLSDGLVSEFGWERKLVPLWHLLALLLTSRSDYNAAEKACEAAFEQFGDPSVLFGKEDANAFRSEHLNQLNKEADSQGLVDRMESFEKTSILHIKMTQLALVETTDGATAAVDGCDELLALYSRLFGDPTGDKPVVETPPATLVPPKSAIGTIRGSIFRGRGSIRNPPVETAVRNSSVRSSKGSAVTAAPAIQVTEEDGTAHANGTHRHHLFHSHKNEDTQTTVTRTPSKLQKRSSASLHRQSIEANETPEVPPLPDHIPNGGSARNSNARGKSPRRLSVSSTARKSLEGGDQPLRSIPHNMNHNSPPLDHAQQPPKQDVRLPSSYPRLNYVPPDPRFSKLQARRQRVSLLVDIWVFISSLYIRAVMFEDAKDAIAEAMKLVETFENEVLQESSTAKALADKGWGGGKSVEELWADAFAARGELFLAQSLPHPARTDFERALLHFPDHPKGIVGLSNILLDMYTETIPLEPINPSAIASPSQPTTSLTQPDPAHHYHTSNHLASHIPSQENRLSPPELIRLTARDRAFGLLSTLTKLGSGWDYSEAWYALARAYEESGQVEKTKEVLWWCVELEDSRPVRSWASVGLGGFVL